MGHQLRELACICPCGKTACTLRGTPLLRFFCHCTICQSLYRKPLADVVAFRLDTYEVDEEATLTFKTYRPPPALQRGTCDACRAPVLGIMDKIPGLKVAFVPTVNLGDAAGLPAPSMHLFYNRRLQDRDDGLPKHKGYIRSELAISRALARSALRPAGSS